MAATPRTDVPAIEVRDLHKSFGTIEVLKGISFTACEGEVVSLIGSSGSGKSTLLRCINLAIGSCQVALDGMIGIITLSHFFIKTSRCGSRFTTACSRPSVEPAAPRSSVGRVSRLNRGTLGFKALRCAA